MEVVNSMWSQALQRMEKDPGGILTEGTLFFLVRWQFMPPGEIFHLSPLALHHVYLQGKGRAGSDEVFA
jgi:hypothetical protein